MLTCVETWWTFKIFFLIFDLLKGNIKQIYFFGKKITKNCKNSPHTKNAGGLFSMECQMGHTRSNSSLHLRIVLFGLGLNLRTDSKMCSSYHMKIMEKCLQDLVLYTPRHNEWSKVEIFLAIWLNLKIFFSILAIEYFWNFGLGRWNLT